MLNRLEELIKKTEELKLTSEALSKKITELDEAAVEIEPKQTPEVARIDLINHARIVGFVEDVCNQWRRAATVCGALLLVTWAGIILSVLL